jgi:hypothetical protein
MPLLLPTTRRREAKFDGRTLAAFEKHRDADGRYTTELGNKDYRVRSYEELHASRKGLSILNHWQRLKPCYDAEGRLVLCLRYLTGAMVPRR